MSGTDSDVVMVFIAEGIIGPWEDSSSDDARDPDLAVDDAGRFHIALVQDGDELWHYRSIRGSSIFAGQKVTSGRRAVDRRQRPQR